MIMLTLIPRDPSTPAAPTGPMEPWRYRLNNLIIIIIIIIIVITFKSVFLVTFHYYYLFIYFLFILDLDKLIQRVHIYICMYVCMYMLYPSPHCLSCARNDIDIYIELFYKLFCFFVKLPTIAVKR